MKTPANPEVQKPAKKPNILERIKYFFQHKLSERQRGFAAIGMTVVIVVLIGGGIFAYKNPNLINTLLGKKPTATANTSSDDSDDAVVQSASDSINKALGNISSDSVIYETINFEDLPIYPQAWVDKYFTPAEQANALIGGPDADPDGDGLSNKQEYLYGTDPKNPDTLCDGKVDGKTCVGRNDKQNVDAGISPLTGLPLDTPQKIKIKKQDLAVIGNLKDSFETAAEEGVDFPTLYELSKTIDLTSEMDAQKVNSVPDTAQGILDYQQFRVEILGDFANDDEFSSFTEIYELSTEQEFDQYIQKYTDIRDKLVNQTVPQRYIEAHRAYILLFQKLIELVQHRKDGVLAGVITDDFKTQSEKISTEMVWAYKRLDDELTKVSDENQG
jgi:hypothetical protein